MKQEKNVLENMPVHLERDMRVMEQMLARDAQAEQQRQEMMGKPIYLPKYDTQLPAEELPRKYQQERRALKFAMAGSDGEYVKIPYSIACMLLKDLDALNAIRLTIQKL